jgi:hypothetical protein
MGCFAAGNATLPLPLLVAYRVETKEVKRTHQKSAKESVAQLRAKKLD